MPKLEDVPEPNPQLPEELRRRIRLAWEAQCGPGFEWGRLSHLRYVDVAGLRFLPTLGDLPVNAYSSAWRLFAAGPLGLAILLAVNVWTRAAYHPLWEVLLCSLPILLLLGISVFLFRLLGRKRAIHVGVARDGLYLTPNLLTLWDIRPGKPDHLLVVRREQVLRFYPSGTPRHPSTWVEYRMEGEVRQRRTGHPALGSADRAWLEHWLATGELPIPDHS
ncbi:MAG: hypothetical protein H6721_16415 [Sandaracinus sp.]|nr:hypothetical protein [Sandaracinus sp.]MCB9623219.1 hypothetical protein [Sandaracinus sp.]MCB9633703.1 hypothetical protein [Sandaracinus sp.]